MLPNIARILAWATSSLILVCMAVLVAAGPGTPHAGAPDGPALYGP